MWLYNIGIITYSLLIRFASIWNRKAQLWYKGREGLFERLREAIPQGERIIWVHVASLGEFEQGRPLIEKLRKQSPDYKILITFFSPSGYEIRKNYEGADYIFYLPCDTPRNARRFVEIVRPEIAIIVKYEFWLNILSKLRRENIDTYIVSAIFRKNSIFFRSYGSLWRKALKSFNTIFVQNEESKELLHSIGYDNVTVAGDTRFDRVVEIARSAPKDSIIERFKNDQRLFIAGSTWEPDEEILKHLIASNPEIKFIIAPHEMKEDRLMKLIAILPKATVRYTQIKDSDDISQQQVLILDTFGKLSSIYQYATWSYIGGGFGVGIHNTLEAATFALPIAFGPNCSKFKEACDMIKLGACTIVNDSKELAEWFAPLRDDNNKLETASRAAKEYTQSNQGATKQIIETILKGDKA